MNPPKPFQGRGGPLSQKGKNFIPTIIKMRYVTNTPNLINCKHFTEFFTGNIYDIFITWVFTVIRNVIGEIYP